MKYTLTIETDSPYQVGLVAAIAEIITNDGLVYSSAESISHFLMTVHDGLSTMNCNNDPYIIGVEAKANSDEWVSVANWFIKCARTLQEIIDRYKVE